MIQKTVVCVALVAALSVIAMADEGQPQACQDIVGHKLANATELSGFWYELVRAPFADTACTNVKFDSANNGTTLNATIAYSSSNSSVYINKHMGGFTNLTTGDDKNGYNLTGNNKTITYKILNMENSTYIAICGYTSSDRNSSFGAVLVRDTKFNTTLLNEIITNTSHVLLNFNLSTVANITQAGCYASSASTFVPYLTSMFALFLMVVKLLN